MVFSFYAEVESYISKKFKVIYQKFTEICRKTSNKITAEQVILKGYVCGNCNILSLFRKEIIFLDIAKFSGMRVKWKNRCFIYI